MTVTVRPMAVSGRVPAPPSKSATHRAYLLAAHSEDPCTVHGPLRSADPDATLAALEAFGATIDDDHDRVTFLPSALRAPSAPVPCHNSGTTLRFLLGLAARMDQAITFTGDASLQRRPNGPLLDALEQLGARTTSEDGCAPVTVQGPLHASHVALPRSTSSQYASSLLLSLPFVAADSRIDLPAPIASAPYLDLTVRMAEQAGLTLQATRRRGGGRRYLVPGQQVVTATDLHVEGDWSGAAFAMAAGALAGEVTVMGLDLDSAQGDRIIIDHLRAFGAHVDQETDPHGAIRVRHGTLGSPGTLDVSDTPDLFPVLAVLAAHAKGTTTFVGGTSLRHKESDRIAAMAQALGAVGIEATPRPDGLVVTGGKVQGGRIDCHHDHRIHMAMAVCALAAAAPITLDAGCHKVSHPTFHDHLSLLEAP